MPTTNIVLETPAHASFVDTWDQPLNSNASIIDACIGSVTTKTLVSGNTVLTTAETRVSILRFTGTLTANVGVFPDPAIRKAWVVENLTLGNFVVFLSGGGSAFVGVPPGSSQIYWDGTSMTYINMGRVGDYWDYPVSGVPTWVSGTPVPPYLLCDGSTFSAATYPVLNKVLGGNTLPDARGRSRFAFNAGTGRLTTPGGINGDVLFASGGVGTGHTLNQTHLPAVTLTTTIGAGQGLHNHPPLSGGQFLEFVGAGGAYGISGGTNANISTTTANATLPALSGTTPLGGSATTFASDPPGFVGGITMIRAG